MMKITTRRPAALIFSTIVLLMLGPMPVAVSAQGDDSPADTQSEANFEEKNLSLFGRDIGFQPRLYTGAMYYQYEQDAVVQEVPPPAGLEGIFTSNFVATSPFEFKTTLPILGGGGTFFADRFFVDVYAQHAFSQSDSTDQNLFSSNSGPSASITTQLNARQDTEMERTEWAVSAGYAVTDNFSLFAGYRNANTDFEGKLSGKSSVNGGVSTADQTSDFGIEFDQDGPFVGFVYGIPVQKGVFDGVVAFDLAVAFLDGKVTQTLTNTRRTNVQVNGNSAPNSTVPDTSIKLDGDTVGLNLGFHWKGYTAINRLSYLIDVVTHRYDFSADESIQQTAGQESRLSGEVKYNEVVVSVRVGLAYAF